MTMRLIPNAAAISELVAGYNGDCGETAEMALLHVINPGSYPLNSADLSTIVKRDISKGWASANGSEPISAIANDLASLGIAHTNYGYSEPPSFDWRAQLAQWGGIKPIVFEYARAANLPGDEAGVQYHFNTCLGWDPDAQSGLFADGDNYVERTGGTALVRYSEVDLVNAQVCGMLVGEYQLGSSGGTGTTMAIVRNADGTATDSSNGLKVGSGIAAYIFAHNLEANDLLTGEVAFTNAGQHESAVALSNGVVVRWYGSGADENASAVMTGLLGEVGAAQALAKSAQDANASLGAARDNLASELTTAQAQIASLQQQLAAAQNAVRSNPEADAALAALQAFKAALASV